MSQAYSLFRAEVVGVRQLTPHLRRITLGGPALAGIASAGLDQRIKLFFPLPGQIDPVVPEGPDWYTEYRAMPEHRRPFMRTYTIRAFRPELLELDVDIVLHGDTGPGSTWAGAAAPGDRVAILAPDARHSPILGFEFRPPADTEWVLLAGDDTALPAIAAIIEAQPAGRLVLAFVEVGSPAEMLPVTSAAEVRMTWLSRAGRPPAGVGLLREAIRRTELPAGKPYVWLAGESSAITDLRRHLVNDREIDKELVYFSGYWLLGSAIE
ncbi:siderophore-interacting protein [Actinophytocola xanthii]|uniref:siderophore-interacting protein n=1 Tax=Actinophytocola xanthii TaxID=1912961 RepID=UPI000A73EEA4|nr:siderophore-interacting protein [Actinophytocola xanthii]